MKILIKKLLREEIRRKEKFGDVQGVEHDLYPSETQPNVLYKVGKKELIDRWTEVFKSNPSIFPKIYRIGKMKDGRYYVTIEKLDTKKALQEWDQMEMALELAGVLDTDVFENTIDQLFIDVVLGYVSKAGVLKRLKYDKPMQLLFDKWSKFLIKTYKYIQKFGYNGLDIHRYNFAYDSSGNIKAIDI
jgi:hypothetical protein